MTAAPTDELPEGGIPDRPVPDGVREITQDPGHDPEGDR